MAAASILYLMAVSICFLSVAGTVDHLNVFDLRTSPHSGSDCSTAPAHLSLFASSSQSLPPQFDFSQLSPGSSYAFLVDTLTQWNSLQARWKTDMSPSASPATRLLLTNGMDGFDCREWGSSVSPVWACVPCGTAPGKDFTPNSVMVRETCSYTDAPDSKVAECTGDTLHIVFNGTEDEWTSVTLSASKIEIVIDAGPRSVTFRDCIFATDGEIELSGQGSILFDNSTLSAGSFIENSDISLFFSNSTVNLDDTMFVKSSGVVHFNDTIVDADRMEVHSSLLIMISSGLHLGADLVFNVTNTDNLTLSIQESLLLYSNATMTSYSLGPGPAVVIQYSTLVGPSEWLISPMQSGAQFWNCSIIGGFSVTCPTIDIYKLILDSSFSAAWADFTLTSNGYKDGPIGRGAAIRVRQSTIQGANLSWCGGGFELMESNFTNCHGNVVIHAPDARLGLWLQDLSFESCDVDVSVVGGLFSRDIVTSTVFQFQDAISLVQSNLSVVLAGRVEYSPPISFLTIDCVTSLDETSNFSVVADASGLLANVVYVYQGSQLYRLQMEVIGEGLESSCALVEMENSRLDRVNLIVRFSKSANPIIDETLMISELHGVRLRQSVELVNVTLRVEGVAIGRNSHGLDLEQGSFTFHGTDLTVQMSSLHDYTNLVAVLVQNSSIVFWRNGRYLLDVSATPDARGAFGFQSLNAQVGLENMFIHTTIHGDNVQLCSGMQFVDSTVETGSLLMTSSVPALSTCYGITWNETSIHVTSEIFMQANGAIGIIFDSVNCTGQNLTSVGEGDLVGVQITGSNFGVHSWHLNGEGGTIGIQISELSSVPGTVSSPSWEFLGTGTTASTLFETPFVLDSLYASEFRLGGSGFARSRQAFEVSWDKVLLDVDLRGDDVILLNGTKILQSRSITSADGLYLSGGSTTCSGELLSGAGECYTGGHLIVQSGSLLIHCDNIVMQNVSGDSYLLTVRGKLLLINASVTGAQSIELGSDISVASFLVYIEQVTVECSDHLSLLAADVRASPGSSGPWSVDTGRLTLQGTTMASGEVEVHERCVISSDSSLDSVTRLVMLPSSTLVIEGSANGIVELGGNLTGYGLIEQLESFSDDFSGVIRPGVAEGTESLRIGTLVGPVQYVVDVSEGRSSRISVENRLQNLIITFNEESWDGTDLYPVVQPDPPLTIRLDDAQQNPLEENDHVPGITEGFLSYLGDFGGLNAVKIFHNFPPTSTTETIELLCPCNDPPYCILVVTEATDPDLADTVEILDVTSPDWYSDGARVCYSLAATSTSEVSTSFVLSDSYHNVSSSASIIFTFYTPPPSRSSSPTLIAPSSSISPQSSSPSLSGLPSVPMVSSSPSSSFLAPSLRTSGVLMPPESQPSTVVRTGGPVMVSPRYSPSLFLPNTFSQSFTLLSRTPSRNPFPSISCSQCMEESLEVPLNSSNDPGDSEDRPERVDIVFVDGSSPGHLEVPVRVVGRTDDGAILVVNAITTDRNRRNVNDNQRLGSAVLDITISSEGAFITDLAEPLKICLRQDIDIKEKCLGYYNERQGKWVCGDRCLQKEGDTYCGFTDHLTSFALLLGGGNRSCDQEINETYLWLTGAFVGAALLLIILAVIAIEVFFRYKQLSQSIFLRNLRMRSSSSL